MRTRFLWLWMIPLLWLLMALAAPKMNTSLWVDEIAALNYAGGAPFTPRSPLNIIAHLYSVDPSVSPVYPIILSLWGEAIGWSEFSLRVLSLLLGLLALAVLYRMGRLMGSQLVGLSAATAVGAEAFFVNYLHDARHYPLLLLLGALTLWAYWEAVYRQRRIARAGFFLALTLLLYTQHTALFFAGSIALYHLLFAPKNRTWLWVSAAGMLAGLLFLPWMLQIPRVITAISIAGSQWSGIKNPLHIAQWILSAFSSGSIPLLGFIGFYALRARGRASELAWALVVFGFVLLVLAANVGEGFFIHPRYAILLWIGLGLLTALAVEQMRRAKIPASQVLGIWMLTGISAVYNPQFIVHDPTWHLPLRELRDSLRPHYQTGDATLFFTPDTLLVPEFHAALGDFYLLDNHVTFVVSNPLLPDDVYFRPMDSAVASARRAWVTYDVAQVHWRVKLAMDYRLPQVLGFQRCGTLASDPAVSLTLFARAPAAAPDAPAVPAAAFGGVQVFVEAAQRTTHGYSVMLGWVRGADVPIETYSVGVHLLDAAGALVRQDDYGLPNSYACRASGFALAGLPAGTYRAQVTVYEWRTGTRLGEPFTLDTLRVP